MQNLSFYGQLGLSKARGHQAWLATQALHTEIECTPKMHQVPAPQMTPFPPLQVLPDPFPGVQVRRVGRELRHLQLPCPTSAKNVRTSPV
jgi:hypothetical protein